MSSGDDPLPIHSLAEAYLYLMITPCAACGKGERVADDTRARHDADARVLTVPTVCKTCKESRDIAFDTRQVEPEGFKAVSPSTVAAINPTQEPSKIIDVGGWITLATVFADAAKKAGSPAEARHVKIEAAQCLDEALLFYNDDNNDLPPQEAFYHERTRKQFQRTPELFSRQRLVSLRAKLPVVYVTDGAPLAAGETLPPPKKRKRRWWPWGKKES